MPMDPPPDIANLSLAQIARLAAERKLPPVEQWNPAHCGHSDMAIDRDGNWSYRGSPIARPEMVRLFATILRREPDGRFVLVTPAEKLDIDVADAPFMATALQSEGEGRGRTIAFALNTGEVVLLDSAHPLVVRNGGDGPLPYIQVRGGLEARLARPVYYELAAMAIAESEETDGASGPQGVWSGGRFFALHAGDASDATG